LQCPLAVTTVCHGVAVNTLRNDLAWERAVEIGSRRLYFSTSRSVISDASQQCVVESLHTNMKGYDVRRYFAVRPTLFHDYDLLVVAAEGDLPVGMLGGSWREVGSRPILYIDTVFIVDSHLNTWLFREMIAMLIGAGMRRIPPFVALKTYSPRVYRLAAKFARYVGGDVYPKIPAETQDPEMVDMATRIMTSMFPHQPFQPDTGLVRGGQASLGAEVFPAMPRVTDRDVMSFFNRNLTVSDQVFVLVKPPLTQTSLAAQPLCQLICAPVAKALTVDLC